MLAPEAVPAAKYWTSDPDCARWVVASACSCMGATALCGITIARAYIDSRASKIDGGTNEIMKATDCEDRLWNTQYQRTGMRTANSGSTVIKGRRGNG